MMARMDYDCASSRPVRFTLKQQRDCENFPMERQLKGSNYAWRTAMGTSTVIQAVAAVIALGLYFLPAILADRRKRHDLLTLALFNACLGWTGFGWLAALYWALQPNPPKDVAAEVEQTRRVVRMRNFSVMLVQRVQNRATRHKSER
jgi:hypothetical protein